MSDSSQQRGSAGQDCERESKPALAEDGANKKGRRYSQAGRQNSERGGFYARSMTALELGDLETALKEGVADEIAMVRVLMRRIFALSKGVEDLDRLERLLGGLSMSAIRLVGMIKLQRKLSGGENAASEAISEALTQVMQELKIHV